MGAESAGGKPGAQLAEDDWYRGGEVGWEGHVHSIRCTMCLGGGPRGIWENTMGIEIRVSSGILG